MRSSQYSSDAQHTQDVIDRTSRQWTFLKTYMLPGSGGVFHGVVRNTISFNIIIVDVCLKTYFDDYYCMSY